ncbi:DUF5990 family protein [Mycobacterium conspicuum]|uniref:Uncharacterized protein n=1 Tax=Mycobacterium conspicuum TaxID=44010 RepID=A0A1X1TAC2_9MYCO|nr:DUF5990 family protein [Mycobacterium conspicuum]ORV41445.1 hypothetical protein AWC00_14615 [Mycobacterium conspicuum]BBZ37514.1 hypothetical protein MCNS_05770 [Mycobacterium conspicuum]
MQIRIEGADLPGSSCGPSPDGPQGYRNIHVGVQRRNHREELLGLVSADAATASWMLDCSVDNRGEAPDVTGPYIQGRPGGRFIYLSWVAVDDADTGNAANMFRRAKLWLDGGVPGETLIQAAARGQLLGRLRLSDAKGNPLCASVRPPLIAWSCPE